MNDRELEELLMDEVLEESLDNEVVEGVTPWKRNFKLVTWGLALTAFDIQLFNDWGYLQLLGIVLLMLGFRGLKKANGWFCAGYIFTCGNFIYALISRFISASIWNEEIWATSFFESGIGMYLGIAITACTYICLWRAIIISEKKAGITVHSVSPIMLFIWYILVAVIVILDVAGTLSTIILLGGYIVIWVGIYNVYKELDNVGYVLKPANILVPNNVIIIAVFAIYSAVMLTIYMNNAHPMEWKEAVKTEDAENIKAELVEMGIPENVVNDMKSEDLEACIGAKRVDVHEEDVPLNEGREVTEIRSDGVHEISTVYDVYELHMTIVSLKLDEEGYEWRMIYHFSFNEDVNFKGSEAISIMDDALYIDEAKLIGDVTGQLLCERDGKTFVSEYYGLSDRKFSNVTWFGISNGTDIVAKFSFDNKSDNCRGYISCELESTDDFPLESAVSMSYYHQNKRFIYPAMTASDIAESGAILLSDKYFKQVTTHSGRELSEEAE